MRPVAVDGLTTAATRLRPGGTPEGKSLSRFHKASGVAAKLRAAATRRLADSRQHRMEDAVRMAAAIQLLMMRCEQAFVSS